MQSSPGSNHSTPQQRKELPCVGQDEHPGAAKATEELEETVAQEGERIYHTGSKDQKRGKEQWSTTRMGAKAIANPEKLQGAKAGKKLRGSFKQGTHRQPTVGAPDQPEQGGNKKKDRG